MGSENVSKCHQIKIIFPTMIHGLVLILFIYIYKNMKSIHDQIFDLQLSLCFRKWRHAIFRFISQLDEDDHVVSAMNLQTTV